MSRIRKPTTGGVPHFETKIDLCCDLLDAKTMRELVIEKVLFKDIEQAERIAERLHRFKQHYPANKDSWTFWEALADALGCEGAVGQRSRGRKLVDADMEEFIRYLPEALQVSARQIMGDRIARKGAVDGEVHLPLAIEPIPVSEFEGLQIIRLHQTGPIETVATGLRNGRVDQRHYYLDPESAHNWTALVRADAYPTHDHCKWGLKSLFDSEPWTRVVGNSQPGTVVMLAGGGAPTKDLLLMKTLVKQQPSAKLTYYVFDVSFYMVTDSLVFIRKDLQADNVTNVTTEGIVGDVLKMTSDLRGFFHRQGNVIFGMTGGTIGNLREQLFFRSLDNVASDGDVLILSADTIDGLSPEAIERMLNGKYNHPDLRRFIRPVVRAVLSETDSQESLTSALDRTAVDVRPSSGSDVPGSWAVTISLRINGRDITLVTSTRYDSSQLTVYAAQFGWEPACQVSSPLNPHYKQFVFCRNKAESTGTV